MDKGAGIELFKKMGERVERGEPLYRIYVCAPSDFKFATELAEEDIGYELSLLP